MWPPACLRDCITQCGHEWLCCRCRWLTAPWNRHARPCPAAPCKVDRLFHGGDLRQRIREVRREAVGEEHSDLLPLQGVLRLVQGVFFLVQGAGSGQAATPAPARPGDVPLWHLLDTAGSNRFSPPGVTEAIEKGLQVTPQGEVVATIQASATWMLELGKTMWDIGLDNSSAVLIGAQEQLIALDESPRARVGETIQDPCTKEFPVKLSRATRSVLRTRPPPTSPTSSTRTAGQSSATRSPSLLCLASEGPD